MPKRLGKSARRQTALSNLSPADAEELRKFKQLLSELPANASQEQKQETYERIYKQTNISE